MVLPEPMQRLPNTHVPTGANFVGPFLSSAGSVYVILREVADNQHLDCLKTTDPSTTNFTVVDTAGSPTTAGSDFIAGWNVYQDGDDLHIVHNENTVSAGKARYAYSLFDMSTDTWDGTIVDEEIIFVHSLGDSGRISVRSDGDVIVAYTGEQKVGGTDYRRVHYARREGGTWTTEILVSGTGTAHHWRNGPVVRGSNDRMHFFFSKDLNPTDGEGYQRTLVHAGNALETFPAAGSTDVEPLSGFGMRGISYDDGGTQRVRAAFHGSPVGRGIFGAEIDSVDAPGAFTQNGWGGPPDSTFDHMFSIAVDPDSFDEYLMYGGALRDLFQGIQDQGTEEIYDGTTVKSLSINIYTRNGDDVLAVLWTEQHATPLRYEEFSFGAAGFLTQQQDTYDILAGGQQ